MQSISEVVCGLRDARVELQSLLKYRDRFGEFPPLAEGRTEIDVVHCNAGLDSQDGLKLVDRLIDLPCRKKHNSKICHRVSVIRMKRQRPAVNLLRLGWLLAPNITIAEIVQRIDKIGTCFDG